VVPLRALFGDDAAILGHRDFQLLLFVTVPTLLGTTVLSPVLDSLVGPFGTTTANVGLLISAFTAPSIVIIPVAGAVADRIGRKPVLVVSLVLFGAAGSAVALTTDFRVALALRFCQGIAFGGLNPIVITSVRDLFDGPAEATGQGMRVMVAGLGQTVFAFLAGLLVVVAWQLPFLLYAMAFPIAVAVAIWFEEPAKSTATADSADGYGRELLGELRRARVGAMVVARGLVHVVWFAFLTYNSIVVVRLQGGSPGQAGAMVALASLVYALVASQAGRVTARFETRLYPMLVGNAALGAGLVTFALAPDVLLASVGVSLVGVGFGVTMSLYRSIITGLAPQRLRAGVVGVSEAGSRISATVTPVAMGVGLTALEPAVGFAPALRTVVVGVGVLASLTMTLCVLVWNGAPARPAESIDA
jgi:ACDE family multidrug resistance protein